ncbi:MAG: threonine synthase [Flavisolibacter sp.]
MHYYSTNNPSEIASFKEATIRGQAPDKGLYFPSRIPSIKKELIENIESYSNEDIAYEVIKPYVSDTIPENELRLIVKETINFPFPLIRLNEHIYSLELFHGPTLAFKDVGARFMSRCLRYFVKGSDQKITVLVATSGDTGGAVANGFYNVQGVEVVILYPSGKVSSIQELQLTTLGSNIKAIEIDGTFDDCQNLVKQAFADKELSSLKFLTSANSINVARWLPQQFYYFFAWKQWKEKENPPVFCVPSGNFGNICAGILANASGLPVKHFIAACNENDVISNYLNTQKYEPRKAVPTISNAMDVGNPSNFIRILEIFRHQFSDLKTHLTSYTISDEQTTNTIRKVYNEFNYQLDPHGAVAYAAIEKYINSHITEKGILIETAHPVKFYDTVEKILNKPVSMPESVKGLLEKKKESVKMKPDYTEFKSYLSD